MLLKALGDARRLLIDIWPADANWTEVRNALVVIFVQFRAVAASTDFTDYDDGLAAKFEAKLLEWGIEVPEPEPPDGLLLELAGLLAGVSWLLDELWPGNPVADFFGRIAMGVQTVAGVDVEVVTIDDEAEAEGA
ncbi:MAG: hypothetical protein AAGM22_23660 [Acidobacteriota bacterium]